MKKSKINLMAIIGMMVAIGTVAFTAPAEKNAAQATYFEFVGNSQTVLDYRDAQNWEPSTGTLSCNGSGRICEVEIEDTSITTPEELADLLSGMPDTVAEDYIQDNIHSEKN